MTTVERAARHRVEPDVVVGGPDPMSASAKKAHLDLCRRMPGCTRAAGHHEDYGTRHVSAPGGVVEWVI